MCVCVCFRVIISHVGAVKRSPVDLINFSTFPRVYTGVHLFERGKNTCTYIYTYTIYIQQFYLFTRQRGWKKKRYLKNKNVSRKPTTIPESCLLIVLRSLYRTGRCVRRGFTLILYASRIGFFFL